MVIVAHCMLNSDIQNSQPPILAKCGWMNKWLHGGSLELKTAPEKHKHGPCGFIEKRVQRVYVS